MKLTADRRHLLDRLSRAALFSPRRSSKEILTRVLVKATADDATAFATDTEVSIALGVECTVERPGNALIPPRVIALIKECTHEDVHIDATAGKVAVTCGSASLTFQVESPDEFPCPSFAIGDDVTTINAQAFSRLIDRTTYACDVDSTRFALGGVLFVVEDHSFVAVATDGRRLSLAQSKATTLGTLPVNCIVPQRALSAISKLSTVGDVSVWSDGNTFHLSSDGVKFSARMVEGRFPNWKVAVPDMASYFKAEVASGLLASAIKQAAIVTDAETRAVNLRFFDNALTITANSVEIGRSSVKVPIDYQDRLVEAKLDYRYCLDFLESAGDDAVVHFNQDSMPVVFQQAFDPKYDGESFTNSIMPMAKDK